MNDATIEERNESEAPAIIEKISLRNELNDLVSRFLQDGGKVRRLHYDPDRVPPESNRSFKGPKEMTCAYCHRTGKGNYFGRWHGENCRSKPNK